MTDVVTRLTLVRQYQASGTRAPHKPLLVLLALGQLSTTGSSALTWSVVEDRLGALLTEFGTAATKGASSAAFPFTRLRSDEVWQLSRDVPHDVLGPLRSEPIEGRFTDDIEQALRNSPELVATVARVLVEQQFPLTIAPDILAAVGLDQDVVFGGGQAASVRKRDVEWRRRIVAGWDRSCAFCGFDGALLGAPVGIEAAHVRWFTFDGPDSLDNGLALCSLHHKLFDRGAVGMSDPETVMVSDSFSATGIMGRAVYDLHNHKLRPRPGTQLPAPEHIAWHQDQVFKGEPLAG